MDKKVLLIIGNGFDLKCGLDTKYIHYYNYQKERSPSFKDLIDKLKRNETDSIDYDGLSRNEHITFFDLFFTMIDWNNNRLDSDHTWADIEDMLLSGFKTGQFNKSLFENCYDCYVFTRNPSDFSSPTIFKKWYQIIAQYLYKKKEMVENGFHQYLIAELDRFSINFAKYICEQVKAHPDYQEKAQYLIMKITGVGLNECEILSFNYTEPLLSPHLSNIHGLAKKEKIVFGITCGKEKEKEATHLSWYYPMTKEYKMANVSAKGIKVSADYAGITDIYVYGSSLGEQDYDFYENLFDQFDFLMRLYPAKIHFCYSVYGDKTQNEIANDITSKVTKLVNTIGDNHKVYGLLRTMIQNGHLNFLFIK